MTNWSEVYDTYLRAASSTDAGECRDLLERCASEDLELISPFPYHAVGRDAVVTQLRAVADAMPGGVLNLVRTTTPDEHHGWFRVSYANVDAEGHELSTGLHVVRTAGDRIAQIVVFVPAVAT